MLENISNDFSTNIFESITGVLNIAPIKISGKYKIVVDSNNIMYLDDYNSRRVVIDKNQAFLPQVGNFLSTPTVISDVKKLKYGGFSNSKQKSYHIPLYINNPNGDNTLPNYFVLNRVQNETITNPNNLHKFSSIVKLIDLNLIGLTNIFNELLQYDYPVFFNFEDSTLTINGYSITSLSSVSKTISLLNNQSNQPYIENVNNKILNAFVNNDMFFPKFINVEFEFDYSTTKFEFNNFFGFFANNEIIENKLTFNPDFINVSIKNYTNKIEYKQERNLDTIIFSEPFIDQHSTATITNINNQVPQVRFGLTNISVGDSIVLIHPDETVFFEYNVSVTDIKSTLNETLRFICNRANVASNLNIVFSVDSSNVLTIKSNLEDSMIEEYLFVVPNNFKPLDGQQKNFRAITDSDIKFFGNPNDFNDLALNNVKIGNIMYSITDRFIFSGSMIFRLSSDLIFETTETCEFFITKQSVLSKLIPVNYYSVNSEIKSSKQFDKAQYILELTKKYIDERTDTDNVRIEEFVQAATEAIQTFSNFNNFEDYLQYVHDIVLQSSVIENTLITEFVDKVICTYYNDENILNMFFNSSGNTAYITPNILNFEKKFYDNNGNLDYIKLDEDRIKFHWFLMKTECPDYLKNDIRALRYFDTLPKLTSRLVVTSIDSDYCETIFLGVKYRLPKMYKNFQFAVYLNPNDDQYYDLSYTFDVDKSKKTIYLVINKYLDFIDLIRGGNIDNQPFLDLSFFYTVNESHNTLSEALYSFKSGGILLCDDTIPVMFESNILTDWKYFDATTDKWYICLKRSASVITTIFTDIFPNEGDFEFFVYSSIVIEGVTYNYVSMKFTIKNIRLLDNEYLWCEDLEVKFFDTSNLFVNTGIDDNYIDVAEENIITIIPDYDASGVYENYHSTVTILVDSANVHFKLLNPIGNFSIKQYYFEFSRNIIYNDVHTVPTVTNSSFVFPEYFNGSQTFDELNAQFGTNGTLDNTTTFQKITLFDRNQLWKIIKDIIKIDVRFKHGTAAQTKKLINELLVNNLAEFADLTSIFDTTNNEYIKLEVVENDYNLVIWKSYPEIGSAIPENKIYKINRYKGIYNPYLPKLENELKFQSDIKNNRQDVLFNIFDKDFAGTNITATGIWKEVSGNIVSSLFTKTDDINITVNFNENYDYSLLLQNSIPIDEMIIVNNNEQYLSGINNNIEKYIKESYVKFLLENFYSLSLITNELGQSLNFVESFTDKYNVTLQPLTTYSTRFQKLIFIFKRK